MIAAVSMVKDEADIIEGALRRMATQVDLLLIADNRSTDGTREILDQLAGELPLTVIDDPEIGYLQSQKMSALAARAADAGADWVVPFDADEVWVGHGGRIADVLAATDAAIASAPILNHLATALDDLELPPLERIGWRWREALGLHKIACRARLPVTIGQGNHVAHYSTDVVEGLLEVRHFPYRSADQFLSKVRNGSAAYAATDLPYGTGQHWREYGELLKHRGPEAVRDWFQEHFWIEDPENDPGLIFDPLP